MRTGTACVSFCCMLVATPWRGQAEEDASPAVDHSSECVGQREAAPFGFRAMEVYKLAANAVALRAADLNGDGRMDLAVAHNDEGTIRLLLQRGEGDPKVPEELGLNEVGSDDRFRVEKFYTEKMVTGLVVGDLNGDEMPDLAYYGDPPELDVVYQTENWGSARRKFAVRDGIQNANALVAHDLDRDGRLDLVLLGKSKVYVFYGKEGGIAEPRVLYQAVRAPSAIHVADVDTDGRPDLLTVVPNAEASVHVRLQGRRGFGPEIGCRLKGLAAWSIGPGGFGGEDPQRLVAATVHASTRRLRLYRWRDTPTEAGWTQAHLVAFRPVVGGGDHQHLLADVNRDERVDVVVSYPDTAQIRVHFQDEDGALTAGVDYPTLAQVNGLAAGDVDGDGEAEIVVTSEKEKAIGVSRWRDGRLTFPEIRAMRSEPVRVAVAPLAVDSSPDVFLVVKAEKGGYELEVARLRGTSLEEVYRESLNLKGSAPSGMWPVDADGDGATDVLVTVPYEDAYLLRQKRTPPASEGGAAPVEFVDISREPQFGIGHFSKLQPSAVTIAERGRAPDRDRTTFLVAFGNYVRQIALQREGRLRVIEQFGGRSETEKLVAAVLFNADADPEEEVAVLDAASNNLQILERSESGTFEVSGSTRVPKLDAIALVARDMNGDGQSDIVLVGKEEIAIVYRRSREGRFEETLSYTVEKEETGKPHDVCLGDLNGDGCRDLIVATAPHFRLLFLTDARAPAATESAEGARDTHTLTERSSFPIFEAKSYMRQDTTLGPREMLSVDVDGDGLEDLLLLIHDRLLLYLQDQPRSTREVSSKP